ncbi:Golgi apyrase [Cladophialophora chaetospira]|uniref:Golgi apyrase n=1 Tax=Cladophialophora chaetospira TaxID=386627 RepID=A0AA38XH11_9EURO|nr:Golgi apyrase [Cladophialophora chaetospira]
MVDKTKKRYGVVLDAGSSGTRVYIYRWDESSIARVASSSVPALPELETKDKWNMKVHPGVSTFGEKPDLVGPDHLKPLLKHALKHIPKHAVPETPIFLLATAGMRLLPDQQQKDVLRNICSYIQSETKFSLPDCDVHIQVIPGETEGLYGWVAANYLLGGFDAPKDHDHGKGHHTYGFLDMGGASAQIAFAPNATEAEKHANDLTLLRLRTTEGLPQEYKVFVTTWLGFGANEARRRYVEDLEESYAIDGILEVPDPCLPTGLRINFDGTIISDDGPSASNHYLRGVGKFDECLRRTFPLLEKDVPCLDEPCLVHGVHVPAIDFEVNHFIGISEYWHTTHEIFEMAHKDKAYDFNTYQNRVKEFCEQDWSDIQRGVKHHDYGKADEKTALEVCFKASWLINMLHDGIGIPRVGLEDTNVSDHNGTKEVLQKGKDKGFLDPFQAVNEIKSTEVSWTMGKMLLYASAEIPPASDDDLPVGFGSNEPGIPADFQYPSGGRLQTIPDTLGGSGQSITDQIHDTLFHSDAPHRLPGFILFLLILIIATFCLCGRERRARLYRSIVPGSSPSHAHAFSSPSTPKLHAPLSFFNRLLNGRKPAALHSRDLEDQRLYDPNDFELNDLSDDEGLEADKAFAHSTNSSRPASSHGRTSPRIKRHSPTGSPGKLRPAAIDRAGLVVRTESRESLVGSTNGRSKSKSRSGSPSRGH